MNAGAQLYRPSFIQRYENCLYSNVLTAIEVERTNFVIKRQKYSIFRLRTPPNSGRGVAGILHSAGRWAKSCMFFCLFVRHVLERQSLWTPLRHMKVLEHRNGFVIPTVHKRHVYMYWYMYESICNAPLLHCSLNSHECMPIGQTEKILRVFSLLQNKFSVSVGFRSGNDSVPQFWGASSKVPKLRGPKLEVRQASTCKSPRGDLYYICCIILAVTGTHSSCRYCGADRVVHGYGVVWWRVATL